jgi:hypothetical protein
MIFVNHFLSHFRETTFSAQRAKVLLTCILPSSIFASDDHAIEGGVEMANSKTETGNRAEAIRRYVDEMKGLVADKRVAQTRIIVLGRRIQKELGIPSGDFAMGVRLALLAERGKQSTVDSIREIMLALGNSLPAIAQEPETVAAPQPPMFGLISAPPVRKRDLVIEALSMYGPMTAAELQTRLAGIGGKFPVAPHLTHLARMGRVKHLGTMWCSIYRGGEIR